MKARLRCTFSILLALTWLHHALCLTTGQEGQSDEANPDPDSKLSSIAYLFFTGTLSNSEKENLLKINSSSEYARSAIPEGTGYDFTIQVAIFTLSESLYITPKLFCMDPPDDDRKFKADVLDIANCLYLTSKKTMKLLKLVRQRCFHHTENSQLNIFPKKVAEQLEFYCSEYAKIEERFAKLLDFIYLLKMILRKAKIHNANLYHLSKLIWKITKSRSFSEIKFTKDLSLPETPSKPKAKMSKKKAAVVSKISTLLKRIDNTLQEKVRGLPFWISRAYEEYNAILFETLPIVEKIWSPMKKNIESNIKSLKKCTASKSNNSSCCIQRSRKKYKLTKEQKLVAVVKEIAKQIRSDIE